jgi:thiamine transport system substrate-binding protein
MEHKMLKYLKLCATVLMLAATPSMAQDKPELVIYTYDSFASEWGPGPAIKEKFEKTCNCVVTFVGLDSSVGILGRIQLEGASSKADIALGLDTSLTAIASATGLFAEHKQNIKGKLALPEDVGFWDDPVFTPVDWGYFAFVYNIETMTSPPRSFEELLDPANNIRLVIQDPRTATPGLGLMLWVNAVYGDKAPEIWAKLSPKIVTVTKGWWDSYSMFLEGEADMVLSYSTSPAYHLIAEGKDNFAAASFAEGHYTQVEVAAVLKSSTKPALARLFLQKMLEPEFQSLLPTANWMYPAAKDAAVPEGFETLIRPEKAFLFSPEEVQRNREAWTEAWVNELSQ